MKPITLSEFFSLLDKDSLVYIRLVCDGELCFQGINYKFPEVLKSMVLKQFYFNAGTLVLECKEVKDEKN